MVERKGWKKERRIKGKTRHKKRNSMGAKREMKSNEKSNTHRLKDKK